MAWSWSHTNEAYEAARANLGRLEPSELQVIWAEWEAWTGELENDMWGGFHDGRYITALRAARRIPSEHLANDIWDRMSKQATCDNGGWNAWSCPFGCHTVSFTAEMTQEEMDAEDAENLAVELERALRAARASTDAVSTSPSGGY
jgi:hypothetical protein